MRRRDNFEIFEKQEEKGTLVAWIKSFAYDDDKVRNYQELASDWWTLAASSQRSRGSGSPAGSTRTTSPGKNGFELSWFLKCFELSSF